MKVLLVDDAAFVRMSLKKILDDMALGFAGFGYYGYYDA